MAHSRPLNIGILTFHHVANLGAMLQAVCLHAFLRDLGHRVQLIDYRPPEASRIYLRPWQWQDLDPRNRGTTKAKLLDRLRHRACSEFLQANAELSRPVLHDASGFGSIADAYDVVFAGSDQIWCFSSRTFRKFNPLYFLSAFDPDRSVLASYAASCGDLESFAPHEEAVRTLARRLHFVSVRDENAHGLLRPLLDQPPELVLDPVLLHLPATRSRLHTSFPAENALLYGSDPLPLEKPRFDAFLHEQGAAGITTLGPRSPFSDHHCFRANPHHLVEATAASRCVITNNFHGVLVALHFRKPFLWLPRPDKITKISDILARLGLIDEVRSSQPIAFGPDAYDSDFENRLQAERQRSSQFIRDVIQHAQARFPQPDSRRIQDTA